MTDQSPIYQQIIAKIRQDILNGRLKPGDRLPPVREETKVWGCTPGTIQRAYLELARAGLVISRAGQGTHVAGSSVPLQPTTLLKRAELANRTEAFLLESLTAGYDLQDIELVFGVVLDRWRSISDSLPEKSASTIRYQGSHDLAISWLGAHFSEIVPNWQLNIAFTGSLGGLMALAEGKVSMAGCHLWDEDSQTYNLPFIRRLLPHKSVTIVTLAERRLGLILPGGNPLQIKDLRDLSADGVRFINRQSGSGTRVWLDAQLKLESIPSDHIPGYANECSTHSEVARTIAENQANAGLGLEQAAAVFGLDFIPLTLEKFDLVMFTAACAQAPLSNLIAWLGSPAARASIGSFIGYVTGKTGSILTI
jgi:putative molybdopterin biosynthesis protein